MIAALLFLVAPVQALRIHVPVAVEAVALNPRGDCSGIFISKYLEWETSVFVSNFDLLWTGEERDASVVAEAAHEQTNMLLGG